MLGFLNPNDRLYFSARQKAVTVSDYTLQMTLVREREREREAVTVSDYTLQMTLVRPPNDPGETVTAFCREK